MYIKNVSASDIGQALLDVANLGESPDHNLTTRRLDPTAQGVNVTLRVANSAGLYAKRGYSGRRTVAACYHGHYEFMAALFRNRPNAKIRSAMATFDGVGEFNASANYLAGRNVGSMMRPVAFGDMCECEQD
jgi:hypothetical protein